MLVYVGTLSVEVVILVVERAIVLGDSTPGEPDSVQELIETVLLDFGGHGLEGVLHLGIVPLELTDQGTLPGVLSSQLVVLLGFRWDVGSSAEDVIQIIDLLFQLRVLLLTTLHLVVQAVDLVNQVVLDACSFLLELHYGHLQLFYLFLVLEMAF